MQRFWARAPALLYGLFLYLGTCAALFGHWIIIVPFLFLCVSIKNCPPRLILGILTFLLFWFYVANSVIYPPEWAEGISGTATVQIDDIVHDKRFGRPYCKLQATVLSFEATDGAYYAGNFPCKVVCKTSSLRPNANYQYQVQASLSEHQGIWTLHGAKEVPWVVHKKIFSLVEWRKSAKNSFKLLLAKHLPPGETRAFLEGVLIGEFHDALLTTNLRRFSLQHITVVSGFHFSLIAAIFAAIIRLVTPWRVTQFLVLLATTGYLLFIGPSPSVLRAWIAVSVILAGRLLDKNGNGMNCLGLGLIAVLAYEPVTVVSLSFQLSFLATWAILLLYPVVLRAIRAYFPRRSAYELVKIPFSEQLLFVLLAFFRSAWGLVISVSLLMLPMSLYCFQTFPLMGLIFNCFFPFLVAISIFLLIMALLLSGFCPLATLLFSASAQLTDGCLTLVNHAPKWLDIAIQGSWLSLEGLVLYLCLTSLLGMRYYSEI